MLRFPVQRAVTLLPGDRVGTRARRLPLAAAVAGSVALCFVQHGWAVEPAVTTGSQAAGSASPANLEVLEVRPNFFMIAGAGGNIGVQVGEDGVVVVPQVVETQAIAAAWTKVHDENVTRDAIKAGMKAAEAYRKYGVL